MGNLRKITADDYGFFLVSISKLGEFIKAKGIKAKNLLQYLAKNVSVLNEAIQKGVLLPINQIDSFSYTVLLSTEGISKEEVANEWNIALQEGVFNISVQNDSLWIISLAQLNEWDAADFPATETHTGYWVESGPNGDKEFEYTGQQFKVNSGDYLVEVFGLERKDKTGDDNNDYGYYFQLKPTGSVDSNVISPDIKPQFNIPK